MKRLAANFLSFCFSRLGCAVIAPVGALGLVLLANQWLSFLNRLDDAYLDLCVRYWGHRKPAPAIIIAGIDDEVYQKNLFNRAVHAQVLENLRTAGARAIFYDVLFDEPRGPEVDGPFVAALAQSRNVVLGAKLVPVSEEGGGVQEPRLMDPLMELIDKGKVSLGMLNVSEDAVKRQAGLAWEANGHLYSAAPLALLAVTSGVPAHDLGHSDRFIVVNPLQIPVSVSGPDALGVRTYHMPICYTPPATGPDRQTGPDVFPVVPYLKLLDSESPELARMKDAVVFIGENTSSDNDLMRTPVGRMKGVEVHAQIYNTLLEGPRWRWPEAPTYGGILLLVAWLAGVLAWLTLSGSSPTWATITGLSALLLTLGGFWLWARLGVIGPLPLLTLAALTSVIVALLNRYGFAANFLSRFVPKEVAQRLLATGTVQEGEIEATVIVTDIRGYTTLSETKTPLQILSMLNEYHTETVAIYHRYDGRVLNYQGDAQIVLFGLPEQNLKDPAGNAVQAALETARIVEQLRERWGITDKANFDVGAGVCTGPVAVGDLGSESGSEYTVIGETVRKCHKVQSQSTALNSNVLLDEPTYNAFRNKARLQVERVENVELEGIKYPVTLYRAKDA